MKKLILIIVIPVLATALEPPPDLEIISINSDHVTVRDIRTGIEDTYLIEGEPVINGWTLDPTDDSLVFELVTDLNMYLTEDLQAYDFHNDGFVELVGGDLIIGAPLVFLENDGEFNFIEVCRINVENKIFDLGDADDDGLIEVLTKYSRSMFIYEQVGLNTYADSLIWQITPLEGSYRVWPRYSDLDDDGLMEVSFQNSLGFRKIDVYENTGDNEYGNNFNIPWPNTGPGQFASGDFDGDGHTEIVGGSDYGVLTIFETVASDSFEMVWQGDLGHPNAFMHRFIGDTDNDGFGEWVSGSHDFTHGGFFFRVYEGNGNDQYHEIFYDSLPGNPWNLGGVDAGDVDDDGIPEFVFSSNFSVGVFKYSSINGWHRVWHLDSLQGTVIPYLVDTNGDNIEEVVIATSHVPNYTRIYSLVQTGVEYQEIESSSGINIYPNPFNPRTTLSYGLPADSEVRIDIFNVLGQRVVTLVDEYQTAGYKSITWEGVDSAGKGVSSGIYFYTIEAGDYRASKKMLMIK